MFITPDMIHNEIFKTEGAKLTYISSGNSAEGIDLPGSHIDIMYVIEETYVIRDVRDIKQSVYHTK